MLNKTAPQRGLTNSQRQALLILGMHRSGTSALTGSLEILGSTSPATQIAGGAQNPRGFFESKPIARLNDALLQNFDKTWDDWRPLVTTPTRLKMMRAHEAPAQTLLAQEFGDAALISIKDPRVCRLLPFWFNVLEQQDIDPLIIFPLRHPEEVAQSLRKRNGFSREHGLILWLAHVLAAEQDTRGRTRCFTRFSQLLHNPVKLAQRMERELGMSFPNSPASCSAEFKKFLSVDLRHFNVREEAVPSKLFRVYRVFKRWSTTGEDPQDYEVLDEMHRRLQLLGKTDLFPFTQNETEGNDATAKAAFELLFYAPGFWTEDLFPSGKSSALTKADINHFWKSAIVASADHRRTLSRKLKDVSHIQAKELGKMAELVVQADDARRAQAEEAAGLRIQHTEIKNTLFVLKTERQQQDQQAQADADLISELHALVARVENARKALENQNTELHALVARVENDRKALENQNTELHALVARVENDRKALEDQNTELHALVARVEEERKAIADSTMWRATAPARKVLTSLRGTPPTEAETTKDPGDEPEQEK